MERHSCCLANVTEKTSAREFRGCFKSGALSHGLGCYFFSKRVKMRDGMY